MSIKAIFYINLALSIINSTMAVAMAFVSRPHAILMWVFGVLFLGMAYAAHLVLLYADKGE